MLVCVGCVKVCVNCLLIALLGLVLSLFLLDLFGWCVCCVGSLRWMSCGRCMLLCLLIVLCIDGSSVSFGGFVVSG